ncbi:AAA family ATPase [Candidatus Bathyarchaeota archaeon]|nr:AAA family ATPase [Candidatus Bathyarchaeota archaeon]
MSSESSERHPSVFRDGSKLLPRYIPGALLHRERQLSMLDNIFRDTLENPRENYMRVVQLLGPTGSGKTSTALWFGSKLQREAGERRGITLGIVHVNCKVEAKTQRSLYRKILMKAAGRDVQGGPTEEYLTLLLDHLRKQGDYLVIILDDVDYLIRLSKQEQPEGGVIYDLTRLNEVHLGEYMNVLGVLFIARDDGFRSLLDSSERSSLGRLVVRMPHYGKDELVDILRARVEEAFNPDTVPPEVVGYVADLASGRREDPGDCRYALDLLLTAGMMADERREATVSLEHVRSSYADATWGPSDEELNALSPHCILVLGAAVLVLKRRMTPYVSVKDVHEFYRMACDTRGVRPLGYGRVRQLILELNAIGGLDLGPKGGVGIAGATLDDLEWSLIAMEKKIKLVESE